MRLLRISRFLLPYAVLLVCALPIFCQQTNRPNHAHRAPSADYEQILSFKSDIALQDDASLQVTETIEVIVTGAQIRHGIYRDFPTSYRDAFNNHYVVGFQMFSATRDAQPELFRVEDYANGKRIYLGDPSAMVPPGRHVYTISYTTTRQLGFFKDHDELYWNVTGNGWMFPIQRANATVHLPAVIPAEEVQLSGYTGVQGSRKSELTAARELNEFQFAATRPLGPREGLSIVLDWPQGYVARPTFAEKLQFFFEDNRYELVLVAGLLVIVLYYVFAWSAVGRDPEPGVIVATYQPPTNLSPAAMRYLRRMGFDNKAFSVAILDMAVRGFLTIKEQAGSYTLYKTGKPESVLLPDEQQIAAVLFNDRDRLWLHQENHTRISGALKALRKWLDAAEQKTYFVTNSRYLIAPIVLSCLVAFSYLLLLGAPKVPICSFLAFWLSLWSLGVYSLLLNAKASWQSALRARSSALAETATIGKAIAQSLFALPFAFFELMAFWFLWKLTSITFVLFVLASACLHVLFFHLMKAPTFAGRQLMDQVEGFKMFLGAVDGDRLNRAVPPEQTPAVFEKFLPYALALDVEQDWAEKFSGILSGASVAPSGSGATYTPSFYSGSSWNGFSGAGFASAVGSSLTAAISSSATAPGSDGGGGGGGSGGGGEAAVVAAGERRILCRQFLYAGPRAPFLLSSIATTSCRVSKICSGPIASVM